MPRKAIGDHVMSPKERQARRREQFARMKDALSAIVASRNLPEAQRIASAALARPPKETR